MTDTPPPHPNGYQPVAGEGLTDFSLRVSRAKDYQTVAVEATYQFPNPVSYSEALPALDATFRELAEETEARLTQLVGAKQAPVETVTHTNPAPSIVEQRPPAAPTVQPRTQLDQLVNQELGGQPAAEQGQPNFLWADKPNGKGSVKYLPQSVLGEMDLVNQAKTLCDQQGLPSDSIVVFDNRDRLSQNKGYAAGSIKPKRDSRLAQVVGDEYLGNVDFEDDGSVSVFLTQKGREAVNALKLAGA